MGTAQVEILVLGPLEARSARVRLQLGGPRQRGLLADLVLNVGAVVSMDAIVDDLWGGAPPPTAEAVVQNAVARLRRMLGREAIETRPPGYVLRVDPGAIDARRFERLVHDARPLPPAERLGVLNDALALWRGPAFADLAFESFLQREIARLDELRLAALEDRIEAEVELGRHDDAIPDAAALAAQHRDRERLCRLLMLALQRAGRQQEALDAFEATRRAMDEQWGLEPSEETRALQRMILTQDPAIAPAHPAAVVVGPLRRPVSLLLVELLLDDELELEAAGAVTEDVRRTVADVAARHGGVLSPESGIELVAAFGVDGAHEDDVVRAARAAVELREILRGRAVELRQAIGNGKLLVEGSRPVLVGAVVARTRRALRDADADEIQLTEMAARLGGDAFDLDVDGRLLGVHPGRPRRGGALVPLVGRSDELAGLRSAFERAVQTGKPSHAVVVGEAGIGKTRLVAAFLDEVTAVHLEAACTPYGEGITFLPLRELAEWAAWLDEDVPPLGEFDSADAALAAARTLVEHFTATDPLVVVLDDLHWAAPAFLDLVEYVVRAVDGPLLVVSLTRPELLDRRAAWREIATTLEPLTDDAARGLLDALPERAAFAEKTAAAILETAEGVPLFLEQLAAHAAESDLADAVIPASLDALLASRIDGLEPGERAVLSCAAVVGRAFSRHALGALLPDTEERGLAGRLAALDRHRLVRPRGLDHEFVHPLVRGAAYDGIGRPERAALHETFARWLDARGEGDALVGTHLERAALDTTDAHLAAPRSRVAATRLGRAGEEALHAFDHAAAANLLGRATALLEQHDEERMGLECSLGHALKGIGELERAVALLEGTAERARAAGVARLELRARIELVYPGLWSGRLTADEATAVLAGALPVLENESDTLGVARAHTAYALVAQYQMRHDLVVVHASGYEDAYRALGHPGRADTTVVLAAARGTTPVGDAIGSCEAFLAQRPKHLRSVAYLRLYLGYLRALGGDVAGARAATSDATAALEALGEELGLGTSAVWHVGETEAVVGDLEGAQEAWEHGLAYTRDRRALTDWHAYFLARVGELALERGDARVAGALADRAAAIAGEADIETQIWWRRVAARAAFATGHPRKAERLARDALALADRTDDVMQRAGARLDVATVLREGRPADASAHVNAALDLLDRKGAVLPAMHARERFADLLANGGDGGAADAAPRDLRS